MDLTPKQQQVLEWLRAKGPVPIREIAEHFGMRPGTANTHMQRLKKLGMANNTLKGHMSTWHATAAFKAHKQSPQQPQHKGQPIEQAVSIWHYAERISRAN